MQRGYRFCRYGGRISACRYKLFSSFHFFDYDNDGDLDMYLLTTKLAQRSGARFMDNDKGDTAKSDVDKLFRNDWNDSLKHPVFTDISAKAGIKEHGYGLGLAVADINKDGWKDIYVTNDFFSNDLLYINNKDGTYSDKARKVFKHTSQNAMGNDVADINNDGLADIIAVDMNPADNFRKKKNMNGGNYYIYQSMIYGDYMLQYVRNTLQLNQGPVTYANDSIGDPVFSDISFFPVWQRQTGAGILRWLILITTVYVILSLRTAIHAM